MKFYNDKAKFGWTTERSVNSDSYGTLILDYAENLMNLMEKHLSESKKLEDVWRDDIWNAKGVEQQSGYSHSVALNRVVRYWYLGEKFAELASTEFSELGLEGTRKYFEKRHSEVRENAQKS
ncbi:hypothetical protein [Liquorilactobacillus hordei]|uniref:Uncharacterized protein n=1 Tax=Liquorilactobacillus hordei DSM 19519 TaxID=1423759 RepID=A0A0R1MJ41_9LACO|nr:hypothetical protein [Liquorilactobacillus hordei]KRL08007.1 hypothetical protein FC92_GL001079 [Liquorilactobacillus hordei DSM 19519]QYH51047.1 hypothetical protein G6O70_00340 [Liquorilactobacillus hordei DSM 19519]